MTATAIVATLAAALAWGVLEGMGRFYPARRTYRRLRSRHGRRAVWAMRMRLENASLQRSPRVLAIVLGVLMGAWIASASLMDKRWYEVVWDVLPYAFVGVAMLRFPVIMRKIAARMKDYEDDYGDRPEAEEGDGPAAVAL